MSSNNQILIKKYKGKWYVFENIMAESWSKTNRLSVLLAKKKFRSPMKALEYACDIYEPDIEYWIVYDILAKDWAKVTIYTPRK